MSILDIFKDCTLHTLEEISPKLNISPHRAAHLDDWEPVSVIEPNLKDGPWIAGGAPLRWYQGLPLGNSDIDVFCRDAVQAAKVIERIKSYGRYFVKFESENAVTIEHRSEEHSQWIIQVITRRYFTSMQDVISNFDLSVCQIGTDGTDWILGVDTARDIRQKNLRFVPPLHNDAVKRLTKYWIYGYRPVEGTLESIQKNPDAIWKYENDNDYGNAF
jgi:hypothetical protein